MDVNGLAARATNHCLTGCGIGEVLGMVLATMEIVDNAVLIVWPDALGAGLRDALFWISLAIALAVAWGPTFLVNRALIGRGKGHARAHGAHGRAL